jgi:hypothetical protein
VTVSIAHTYIYSPLNVTAHAPVIVNVTDNHQKYIPSFQSAVDVTIFSYMPAIHYTTGWPEFPANRTEFPNRDLSMLYPDEQQYVSATTKHWWDVEWTWMGMDGYAWEMGVLILAVLILCAVIAFGVLARYPPHRLCDIVPICFADQANLFLKSLFQFHTTSN